MNKTLNVNKKIWGVKNIVYNLMINFEDIINHQIELLRYAGKNSDTFTVITTLKKPYSKRPPNFIHDKIMMELSPYMVDYIVGIKE